MVIRFKVPRERRRELVTAMGEIMHAQPQYMRLPSKKYRVSYLLVSPDCQAEVDDGVDMETLQPVLEELAERGFRTVSSADPSLEPTANQSADSLANPAAELPSEPAVNPAATPSAEQGEVHRCQQQEMEALPRSSVLENPGELILAQTVEEGSQRSGASDHAAGISDMRGRETRRYPVLTDKDGSRITWLEAVVRSLDGLGHPANAGEIINYMQANVIQELPGATPENTIHSMFYTYSEDSSYGRRKGKTPIFYAESRGVWGLLKWRSQ
ncbi:MAG: winged helix-turn-helix domain-containing protein [Lachnospiraceae bacterium]|nr:winged helix-turn-helix domain-containing protein [Lachnospiraceae bacterium]